MRNTGDTGCICLFDELINSKFLFAMKVLIFVCLLLATQSHSNSQSDPGDILFLIKFARAYLCKGDNNWWRKIPDPTLRVPMQFAVLTMCTPDFDKLEAVRELDHDARAAMKKITAQKRNTIEECLWSAIKDWMVIPFLCPLQHVGLMKTHKEWLVSAYSLYCIELEKDVKKKFYCTIMKTVLRHLEDIRKIAMRVIKCAKKDIKRDTASGLSPFSHLLVQKRQYSAYSLINTIKDGMCIISSAGEIQFYSNEALVEKGQSPFIYSAFCCMFHILE